MSGKAIVFAMPWNVYVIKINQSNNILIKKPIS